MNKAVKKIALIASLALGVSAPMAQAQSAAKGYWQRVQASGELRCGAAISPPWVMRDPATGEYSGLFSELCKQFAGVLNVKPVFVDTTWDNIVAGLQAGKWDMSMSLNQTPVRAMAISFTIPVVEYEISLAYNKQNPKIEGTPVSVADIDKAGVTLAVMSGTAQDKAISAAVKNATVLRLPTNDETRLAVQSRRADILVDDSATNDLWVRTNPDWATSFRPQPALAKQGIAFGLAPQMSASDIAVPDIFIREKIALGEVETLKLKAIDASLGTSN